MIGWMEMVNLSDKVAVYGFITGAVFSILFGIALAFGDHTKMADEFVIICTRLIYTIFIVTFFMSAFIRVSGIGDE